MRLHETDMIRHWNFSYKLYIFCYYRFTYTKNFDDRHIFVTFERLL